MMAFGGTIMLVDDHAVVREGYRSVLQKQPGLTVIAEASDGAEAYRLFKETRPDVVIMDLTMPGVGGIEAIRRIRQWDRAARILVFTMHENAGFAVQAIRAGARGYVTKTSPPETLVRAVMDVLAGHIAMSPDIDHQLALGRLSGEAVATDVLTAREFEVLQMLLAERTTQEIADALHLSPKTVANLHSLIKDKSSASARTSSWSALRCGRGFSHRRISMTLLASTEPIGLDGLSSTTPERNLLFT
jgi:two-component system, NarL family, invasion response regulator UvrY